MTLLPEEAGSWSLLMAEGCGGTKVDWTGAIVDDFGLNHSVPCLNPDNHTRTSTLATTDLSNPLAISRPTAPAIPHLCSAAWVRRRDNVSSDPWLSLDQLRHR